MEPVHAADLIAVVLFELLLVFLTVAIPRIFSDRNLSGDIVSHGDRARIDPDITPGKSP
jgi:hypothetical protein